MTITLVTGAPQDLGLEQAWFAGPDGPAATFPTTGLCPGELSDGDLNDLDSGQSGWLTFR